MNKKKRGGRPTIDRGDELNLRACSLVATAKIFNVSRRTIERWISEDGAPKNEDGSVNLNIFVPWRIDKVSQKSENDTRDLVKEKLAAEIEKLTLNNEKIKENMVDRSLHEQILSSRASTLRRYLEQTLLMNLPRLAGRTVEEMRGLAYDLSKEMMDVYCGREK